MPMLHQELDAVLIQRDGKRIVFRHALQHLHIADVEFVASGRAFVGAHFAGDDDGGFLGKVLYRLERFGGNRALGDYSLNLPAAIAKNRKKKLPALAQVIEPSADSDFLAIPSP